MPDLLAEPAARVHRCRRGEWRDEDRARIARRAGLTIRYSGTNVKNDLSVNPHFKAYLARGTDRYHHNPEGIPPASKFGRPDFKAVSIEEARRS